VKSFLQAKQLTKNYTTGTTNIGVLKGVSLEVSSGEMTAVIGASGSGKTTLLQILGTLDLPDSGELLFNGESLLAHNGKELAAFRNRSVGFIFQFHHLLPDFTALENVMMPALIAGEKRSQIQSRATELLQQVELHHRAHHKVGELSGGEQQRAALARALVMKPALLLADEPTGNLDAKAGEVIFSLLQNLCKERGLATIMVTHNNQLAGRMDQCFTLSDGILQ